ncbi:uncharacterized protein M437DRAFT_64053 [Aureobasidium melanogenum CBS 110374]|uniref:Uncharacterized protein n=1 Tax=Aureobasidium melanogenum (strain CBS 110374) TaxID=1043003 RepID=A0A074VX93_AURM1|nr:uncharacterized protein M437DRAFT_64053 [Aureobasidium melanogenum CBS 110374]KEQ65445.1 hypothetical protein M437DRAFT_64053 [Aureobasidium melanogenum CBS 110374]
MLWLEFASILALPAAGTVSIRDVSRPRGQDKPDGFVSLEVRMSNVTWHNEAEPAARGLRRRHRRGNCVGAVTQSRAKDQKAVDDGDKRHTCLEPPFPVSKKRQLADLAVARVHVNVTKNTSSIVSPRPCPIDTASALEQDNGALVSRVMVKCQDSGQPSSHVKPSARGWTDRAKLHMRLVAVTS